MILENTYKSDDGQYFFNKTKQLKTDAKQYNERNTELHGNYKKLKMDEEKARQGVVAAFDDFERSPSKDKKEQFEALINKMSEAIENYKKVEVQLRKVNLQIDSNSKNRKDDESEDPKLHSYKKDGKLETPLDGDYKNFDKAKEDTKKRAEKTAEKKQKEQKREEQKKKLFSFFKY